MEMQAEGIRLQSAKYERVQNLMHNVNEQTLMAEHRKQSRRKAVGIDGVTKEEYDKNAEANIHDLMQKMQKFQYKPLPVKRVYIPKGNGKMRPLGLPSYEDKLVQGVMAKLLNDVYEVRFPEHDIDDKNFLRYIKRFLTGGIMEGTELKESDKGTPQGGLCEALHKPPYAKKVVMLSNTS